MEDIIVTAVFRDEECNLHTIGEICRCARAGHQDRLLIDESRDETVLVFWIGIIDPTNNELQDAVRGFLERRGP